MPVVERLLRSKRPLLVCLVLPALWPVVPFFVLADPSALAEPTRYVLHHTGLVALVLVLVVLTFSPLRVLFPGAAWTTALQRHRRWTGVAAFAYAAAHLGMYFVHEGGAATLLRDWNKPFILVGLLAFAILLALAGTSWNGAVRRLGARRWKRLHRIVYVAIALATLHQIWAVKVFPMQVVWLVGPLLVLEALRVAVLLRRARAAD